MTAILGYARVSTLGQDLNECGPQSTFVGAGVIVVVAVTAAVWLGVARRDSGDDCAAVREMIAVNHEHVAQVDAEANAGVQPTQDEYEQWAHRLRDLAAGIDDPKLAAHARRMADLAGQSVTLNSAMPAELAAPQPGPGPAATKYAALNQQFVAEQRELDRACPA